MSKNKDVMTPERWAETKALEPGKGFLISDGKKPYKRPDPKWKEQLFGRKFRRVHISELI